MGRLDLPDKTTDSVMVTKQFLNNLYEELEELRLELAGHLQQLQEIDAQG